jgi:DNA-directed RNA polymerase subunit E'/Rpb7
LPNKKKADMVSFELLKRFARAHLQEGSKVRAMVLDDEPDSVPRQEMVVKLDMYNRLLGKEKI